MTYNEALEYIHSVEWLGSRPGLSRTQELLGKLGNPEKDMRFIHIAGTNGKGSTCAMLDSILREAGYKVGLYTSPYIVRFNERMRINGESISDDELAELVSVIKPIADDMEDKPTEFEIITAIAFLYYKRNECDVVVLEVGMGGRLDSTNVIESPLVSVITGIALDHTAVLGNTVSAIATEKAGIIKSGRPVVYGGRDDVAFDVIAYKAFETSSSLVRVNHSAIAVKSMDVTGTVFDYDGMTNIKLSLCGGYQPENASTVIETIRALNEKGFCVSEEAMRDGFAKTKWRARFELLNNEPIVIFDGSHNIQGITAAANSIKQFFGNDKVLLLMGVLADKDYHDMVGILAPLASRTFTITPPSPRALSSKELSKVFFEYNVDSLPFDTIDEGVSAAFAQAKTQNMPLVMLGSLYMYGSVYNALEKAKNKI